MNDEVSLYEGLLTTRAIRRYADEPVPDEVLRDILFAATRAPSGSNRQPFRFVVLRDGPVAAEAKRLIGDGGGAVLGDQEGRGRLRQGIGGRHRLAQGAHGPHHAALRRQLRVRAGPRPRLLRALPLARADKTDGASIYPACQNLLLAARALGYGGVLTGLHHFAETELRELLHIPETVDLMATITLGRPQGRHGPVRRRPLPELVFGEQWGQPPEWAVDPPGVRHTSAGPPRASQ